VRRRAALLVTLPLALACGCGDDARKGARPAPVPSTAPAAPAPRAEAPMPAIELPPPGEARAVRNGARYALASNDAPAGDALAALADEAGFAIEGELSEPDARTGRIELRDVTALAALRAVLAGEEYVAHVEPQGSGGSTLSRVTIGPAATPPAAAEPAPAPDARARRDAAPPGDEESPGEAERRALVDRDWQDPRDSVRLEAMEQMEPELDRDKLAELLRADPSPEVRAAAADLLAESEPFAATEPLLAALGDRDPAVVLAAVRSLEDVYDAVPNPRIRERVAALREHGDPSVRAAVADFEEWIAP
jgi:hypothetical protein